MAESSMAQRNKDLDSSGHEADLETALTECGHGIYNVALLILAFVVNLCAPFETGSISYVIPAASHDLQLTPEHKAMLQSACFAGMVSSGFLWGCISDALGRKYLIAFGLLMSAILNILAGAFSIVYSMIAFKYFSGLMFCGPLSIFTAYLSEVFPKKWRNTVISSLGIHFAIGQIVQAGVAMWIIPADIPSQIPFKSWQVFQMVSSLPELIGGIGCLFLVESPKFLADKGNYEGALKVCRTIYSINTGKLQSDYPVKKLNHITRESQNKSTLSKFKDGLEFFKPRFIKKAVIIFFIHIGAVGINNILRLWLPEIFSLVSSSNLDSKEGLCPLLREGNLARNNLTSEELKNGDIYFKMILVYVGVLIGQICFLIVVNFVGKKMMEFCCALLAGINAFILPLISAQYDIILASISLTLYNICIICNIAIMVEIYPTRMKATSVSVLMLTSRIATFTLNFLVAKLINDYCEHLFYSISFYSFAMAGMVLLITKHPIEDKL